MGSMEGLLGAVLKGLGSLFSADGLLKTFMGSVEGISEEPKA